MGSSVNKQAKLGSGNGSRVSEEHEREQPSSVILNRKIAEEADVPMALCPHEEEHVHEDHWLEFKEQYKEGAEVFGPTHPPATTQLVNVRPSNHVDDKNSRADDQNKIIRGSTPSFHVTNSKTSLSSLSSPRSYKMPSPSGYNGSFKNDESAENSDLFPVSAHQPSVETVEETVPRCRGGDNVRMSNSASSKESVVSSSTSSSLESDEISDENTFANIPVSSVLPTTPLYLERALTISAIEPEFPVNICFDLLKTIRSKINHLGYFDQFPCPNLLLNAQNAYRNVGLHIPIHGNLIVPHPPRAMVARNKLEELFVEADKLVGNTPESIHESLLDVVQYVSYYAANSFYKVRGFYVWLQDIQKTGRRLADQDGFMPVVPPDTPLYWCQVFKEMCRLVGITTRIVEGYVKGSNYEPLEYCPGNDLQLMGSAWISVMLDKTWWLIDPVRQTKKSNQPQYFLTEPEQFIFSHFPKLDFWQLLARPVNIEEFCEMTPAKQTFFNMKIKLISHPKSIINVAEAFVVVTLGFSGNENSHFSTKFIRVNDDKLGPKTTSAEDSKIFLYKYTFIETFHEMNLVKIKVMFPCKGNFLLYINGTDKTEAEPLQLCSYKINCKSSSFSLPLPPNPRNEWGPGSGTLSLGITPISHKCGEVVVGKDPVVIWFKVEQFLNFDFNLVTRDGTRIPKQGQVRLQIGAGQLRCLLTIHEDGQYGLYLYAKNAFDNDFSHVCSYLLTCSGKDDSSNRTSFVKKDVKPTVDFAPESGRSAFSLDIAGLAKIFLEMKSCQTKEIDQSEHCCYYKREDKAFISLNFPFPGLYSVRVFGQPMHGQNFKLVSEKYFQVDVPSIKWSPFPKSLTDWFAEVVLQAPTDQHLPAKSSVSFSVQVPDALDVAVKGTRGWFHLDFSGSSWTGDVDTGVADCILMARFDKGSEEFSKLYSFKIVQQPEIQRRNKQQLEVRQIAKLTASK